MNISRYEDTGLEYIENLLENGIKLSDRQLETALIPFSVSFVLEGIDRLQSTLLCELKFSYVQQSQRYVSAQSGYKIPDFSEEKDREIAQKLTDRLYSLYFKMSERKQDAKKGRPRPEDYVYNIPIEDARYILPLCSTTNLSISMDARGLVKLFARFKREDCACVFEQIKTELLKLLPKKLGDRLCEVESECTYDFAAELYNEYFDKITYENDVVMLNAYGDAMLKAGLGALTSTQQNPPSAVLENWGKDAAQKAEGVVNRVMGYGHTSIAEQARTTFGMMCSMVTYHQQIRHRLPEMLSQPICRIIENPEKPVIPQSIMNSKFADEFLSLYGEISVFRKEMYKKYGFCAAGLILNCDRIRFIISTNARIDCQMLAERICMTAQWEIRRLSAKKLDILRSTAPILYKNALPSCVYGKCKEGAMTCGKADEMRRKYGGR